MAPVTLACPSCQARLKVVNPRADRGTIKCPRCGTVREVPPLGRLVAPQGALELEPAPDSPVIPRTTAPTRVAARGRRARKPALPGDSGSGDGTERSQAPTPSRNSTALLLGSVLMFLLVGLLAAWILVAGLGSGRATLQRLVGPSTQPAPSSRAGPEPATDDTGEQPSQTSQEPPAAPSTSQAPAAASGSSGVEQPKPVDPGTRKKDRLAPLEP